MRITKYNPKYKNQVFKLFLQYPYSFEKGEYSTIKKELSTNSTATHMKYLILTDRQAQAYISAGLAEDSKNIWHITWIVVDKNSRGKNMGTALIKLIEDKIQRTAIKHIFVRTGYSLTEELSINARNFYKKMGYQQVGLIPNYWREGDSDATFYKNLNPIG
jgi:ribosomal protein S18 acetylase RimI-like enzyme